MKPTFRKLMNAAIAATLCISSVEAAELLNRAIVPSASFSPGPTSGQFATGGNGVATPFINRQPVQGFSAVIPGASKGTYLVMADNGFGTKANSPDALLRVYTVRPDFELGTVSPVNRFNGDSLREFSGTSFFTLSDPWRKVPFPIVADAANYPGTAVSGATVAVDPSIRQARLLTGADFDIESIRRGKDGTLWFGDEFGPYLLHTDANGRVLDAPIPLPNFRRLPSTTGGADINPLIQAVSNPQRATVAANLPDSGGFEGMALNESRTRLYAMLEKAVNGDPVRERLLINEFDLRQRRYTGRTFGYLLDSPTNAIGDLTALTDREFLVIERDGGQGDASDPRFTSPARFKKIFRIELDQIDSNGNLIKQEVADLMNIYDPRDVADDGYQNTVFKFPFTTIEDVLALDNNRLLVINDNNYPGSAGRTFGAPDDNEFIVLHVAPLLDERNCRERNDRDRYDQLSHRDDDDYRGERRPGCSPSSE
ncbi:MAG: esterase-like activity of phytase family protein [Steroidobacteraceae bacterium]